MPNEDCDLSRLCDTSCSSSCEEVFDRIWVSHKTMGETIVEWALKPTFQDKGTYTYQLQLGRTGTNLADDWVNVGLPVEDNCYAVDDTQRLYGRTQWTHYRICLTTDDGTYTSKPEPVYGRLGFRDWLWAKRVVRGWSSHLRQKGAGTEGYLLKRRLYGTNCTCIDEMTAGIRKPQHVDCYGTGIVHGYFDPVPCVFVELSLESAYNEVNENIGTTGNGPRVQARMINIPQVFSGDVWVNKYTDERWYIHEISTVAEIRGVPLIIAVGMELAPFKDVIYQYPID